jgi:tetratricopeptide (TPR) repeat protein
MRALLIAVSLLAAWPARAQLDVESAKAHFSAGSHDFEAGRFADALGEFEKAYKLSGRAPLLYNIGVCHERLGHLTQAIDAFEQYLRDASDGVDRGSVEERIGKLREQQRLAIAPRQAPALSLAAPPPRDSRPVYRRAWFWGVVGGAAAVVIVGVTVGVVVGTRDSTRVLPDVRPQ